MLSKTWREFQKPQKITYYSHHYCHALHALHSRKNYSQSKIIITLDGGGTDFLNKNTIELTSSDQNFDKFQLTSNSITIWKWENQKLNIIGASSENYYNFGALYNGITEYVLGSRKVTLEAINVEH